MVRILSFFVLALATCRVADAGIEVHTTTWEWTQTGQGSPFAFTATPVPLFDDQNGTRRLGLVRISYSEFWQAQLHLDNPLLVRQCMEYTSYNVHASVSSSAVPIGLVVEPITYSGRLGADPFQSASQTVMWTTGPSSITYARRQDLFEVMSCIGTGLIHFSSSSVSSGFDTFRIEKGDPNCNGGFRAGSPIGFSIPMTRFECDVTWEYHWVPSGCLVDLTTLANPAHPLYGVPDGIVDAEDFFYFLAQFTAGNLAVADLTATAIPGSPTYGVPNGVINNDDFFYFLTLFATGC